MQAPTAPHGQGHASLLAKLQLSQSNILPDSLVQRIDVTVGEHKMCLAAIIDPSFIELSILFPHRAC